MRVTRCSKRTIWVACGLGLAFCLTPSVLGDPDVCCPWPTFPDYGDGADGTVVITTNTKLPGDKRYKDVTVQPGVTLDTCGFTLRVCDTLLNYGIITDTCSGGIGGAGGLGGNGHDPWEQNDPPACMLQPNCAPGGQGLGGGYASCDQAGDGGQGGGGGGGGGGAWYNSPVYKYDADGGNGGDGGAGGRGGGYVKIWAFRLLNQPGAVIRADGEPGAPGGSAAPKSGCPCQNYECGPERCEFSIPGVPPNPKDVAAGGGGGGGGGAGGEAGTVEIHYGELQNQGQIRALPGAGGVGGGDSSPPDETGCTVVYGVISGDHANGCSGGAPNGGSGGRGAHDAGDHSDDGSPGTVGAGGGAPGTVLSVPNRPYCKIGGQCYWDGETDPSNACQECNTDLTMTSWSPKPQGTACNDGVFCNGTDSCNSSGSCIHSGNPCPGPDGDGNCAESCNEAADNCTAADPNGSACNDGLYCNGADTCSSGSCSQHAGNPCPGPDGDGNCAESCNEAADNCTAADPNDSACNDGLYCNGADTCSSGSCSQHAGNPCPGPDGDGNCAESCSETADNCTTADPDGSVCDDGLYCNGADTCSGGSCSQHMGNPCPGPDGDSNCAESCNETADNCNAADPSGSACDDGLFCNGADACSGGTCSRHAGYPCAEDEWCDAEGCFTCSGHDGDINHDGVGDGGDIQRFVEAVLVASSSRGDVCPADFSDNGVVDLADLGGMVNILLAA